MPAPAPFSNAHQQQPYPALYLYPLNDSFIPKHISLAGGQRVKIGRQTNAKTIPGERNGFFDSKVLSRQHAEVWEEAGTIYIKDVKSSNGTFINGDRLSPEGAESTPLALKNDDIVEFGIDIVGEDNKTIIHHKVAARIVCILSEQDAQVAARAEQHQQQQAAHHSSQFHPGAPSLGGNSGSQFNFSSGPGGMGGIGGQRRAPLQGAAQAGLMGMGGMGGSMRPPGKSGLSFDHILSRLQGELQKSRDTGAELHNLTGAMSEVHETLSGHVPQNLPPYPHTLPPVRSNHNVSGHATSDGASQSSGEAAGANIPALNDLRAQLQDTQSSLASHVDKIRALEGVLQEQDAIRNEVNDLREFMREQLLHRDNSDMHHHPLSSAFDEDSDRDDIMDDDAQSIDTIVPHELERVEEEEEASDMENHTQATPADEEQERRRRREELGRPRTPEPGGLGMMSQDDEREVYDVQKDVVTSSNATPSADRSLSPTVIDTLTSRLVALSNQLESALNLSTSLQAQHKTAQSTIEALEAKVERLESMVQSAAAAAAAAPPPPAPTKPEPAPETYSIMQKMILELKEGVEGKWSSVMERFDHERARMDKAKEEWENKFADLKSTVAASAAINALSTSLPNGNVLSRPQHHHRLGSGLVTPPSPRSLSADSSRPRHRRRRSGSSRGRSRSRSGSTSGNVTDTTSMTSVSAAESVSEGNPLMHPRGGLKGLKQYLPTPEASLQQLPKLAAGPMVESPGKPGVNADERTDSPMTQKGRGNVGGKVGWDAHTINVSTAVGVLVLGVAAAAVIWRVKPSPD